MFRNSGKSNRSSDQSEGITVATKELASTSETHNCEANYLNLCDLSAGKMKENEDKSRNDVIEEEEEERGIKETEREEQLYSDEMETDNNTMDIRTVVKMIQDLKIEIKEEWKKEFEKFSKTQHECDASVQVKSLQARLQVCEARERMMIDTMAYMSDSIKELNEKMEQLEISAAKKSVILSGLTIRGESKSDCRKEVEFFLLNTMSVDIKLEDTYFIGSNNPRDIVLVLATNADKRYIFQNIESIKNLKNDHGKKYYFRDYLTARQNQFRRKGQHVADVILVI